MEHRSVDEKKVSGQVELQSDQLNKYFEEQLRYDHLDHIHPSNTAAVIEHQHRLIITAVQRESQNRKVRFLDIGCGWGDFSNKLDPFLTDYIGVEPSIGELRQFERRPNRYLINGVGENLDFIRSNSRNVILLNSVLDHCLDWKRTFANCNRILCPGGILVISMENGQKLIVTIKETLHMDAHHEGHLAFFSYKGLREFLVAQGFALEQGCTFGYLFGFHQLTSKIPLPLNLMRLANHGVNAIMRPFCRQGGQILFFVGRKPSISDWTSAEAQPFQCPRCTTAFDFGTEKCTSCNFIMPYTEGRILDSLAFAHIEKIIEGTTGKKDKG
jgi:2-polyprenyl-3-methyl-5-hydroxy-6-metoxy-1,4-benzoquinol methylase